MYLKYVHSYFFLFHACENARAQRKQKLILKNYRRPFYLVSKKTLTETLQSLTAILKAQVAVCSRPYYLKLIKEPDSAYV
jgi:hypothetical protein